MQSHQPPDREPDPAHDSALPPASRSESASASSPGAAEQLYLAFAEAAQSRTPSEYQLAFDALCAKHPEHAAELRRLRQLEGAVEDLLQNGSGFFRPGSAPLVDAARGADGLARSFEPGETIGDFTLVRFIGHGGMGQVWEARQNSMRRPVALKFLLPGRADERMIALFEREARAGGRANHQNLVRTLARGETDGIEWIAQELVEGSFSLRDAIERFRREPALPKDYYRRCASLVQAIAQGLQAAHDAGVIHRDLKPQNILIDSRDTPRVADFGLARIEGDTVLSKSGDVAGTYQYMSPEQVSGARSEIDHRTDVFSLGVVLYELLTLQRPFNGDTTHQVAEQIAAFDPPEPSKLRAQCPRDLSLIALKALEKRPAARYASMRAFAEDIGRFLRHEPILAQPATRLESVRKWVMRNPAPSMGMAVGAVALVVISGVAVYARLQATEAAKQTYRADQQAREAQAERDRATTANKSLREKQRDQLLRGLIQDVARFRAQCRSAEGLGRLGVPAYKWWITETRRLIEGEGDWSNASQEWRPGLEDVRTRLAELRTSAEPYTEASREKDRATHSLGPTVQSLEYERSVALSNVEKEAEAELLARSTRLAAAIAYSEFRISQGGWPTESEIAERFMDELSIKDSQALNERAWSFVDPEGVRGSPEQLVLALLLSTKSVEMSEKSTVFAPLDTQAWALAWLGRVNDARVSSDLAIARSGDQKMLVTHSRSLMEKVIAEWAPEQQSERSRELQGWKQELERMQANENRDSLMAERSSKIYARYDDRIDSMKQKMELRRTWTLTDPESQWLHDQLVVVEDGLQMLEAMLVVAEASVQSPAAKVAWQQTIESLAILPAYKDVKWPGGMLTPQIGLIPLGEDPKTGLLEFMHLQSAAPGSQTAHNRSRRTPQGDLVLLPDDGMVLVLLPGGKVPVEKTQASVPKLNRQAQWVTTIELAPFFLGKHEMTHEQWDRLSTRVSVAYGRQTDMNPVNSLSWDDAQAMWERELGWCGLPTEVQWEYGCRAGTTTQWWSGDSSDALAGVANLGKGPIPIGSLQPNAFGLHDTHGNVVEWCADTYFALQPPRPVDGLRNDVGIPPEALEIGPSTAEFRALRGGAFSVSATQSRSGNRIADNKSIRRHTTGLRVARVVTP